MSRASGLNEFYGSRAQLAAYHARFWHFLSATPSSTPILDLGCGSGGFLEIAREFGRRAIGVESACDAVQECARKGLEVVCADALEFMQAGAPCSFSGIYCSHLIEHLTYPDACRLLDHAQRLLVQAGRLVVMTPNPASLDVIAETFWLDPTHVRPYPFVLLQRMIERTGFEIVAAGQDTPPGLPRRTLLRRLWLRLVLGKYFGKMNSFVVGEKRSEL